jgi:hypothetical protein
MHRLVYLLPHRILLVAPQEPLRLPLKRRQVHLNYIPKGVSVYLGVPVYQDIA